MNILELAEFADDLVRVKNNSGDETELVQGLASLGYKKVESGAIIIPPEDLNYILALGGQDRATAIIRRLCGEQLNRG